MTRGILYIAKGEPFVREAKRSADRTSSVIPDSPIALITDHAVESPQFDHVIQDSTAFEKADKPRLLQRSPFDETIYLDTDIYLEDTIGELFDLLTEFDVALVPDRAEDHIPTETESHPIEGVPEGFPEFNSGVIAYRSTAAVMEFLTDWQERCGPEHEYDQRSLRPALYHSDLRFTSLPRRYNCMYRHSGHLAGPVKAFHGPLVERNEYYVDPGEAVRKLNATTDPRAFFGFKNTVVVYPGVSIPQKLLITSRIDGPQTAIKASLRGAWRRLADRVRFSAWLPSVW